MPTPVYRFRLALEDQEKLLEMAKMFGSPNTSAFLREMVGAMCSGEQKRVMDFVQRFMAAVDRQVQMDFMKGLQAGKPASVPKETPRKGKVRAKHGRPA